MSKESIRERNKAISEAWKREQQLVKDGKGTRDWTIEQQKDILDPKKGKAYDDRGRAFDGQHMKSAAKYPEYQGNPDNIQFLTKDEHLEAHKGSWQNPTNWYYDPKTKEYTVFEEDELLPCLVIELSNTVSVVEFDESNTDDDSNSSHENINDNDNVGKPTEKTEVSCSRIEKVEAFFNSPFFRYAQLASDFGEAVTSSAASRLDDYNSDMPASNADENVNEDITVAIPESNYPEHRSSACENDVSPHKQRYHTRDGVVWKDKSGYHRGG